MRPFFVYILRCPDGSYYVGHTDDIERRMEQHQAHRRVELLYVSEVERRDRALALERQLKGWSRAKKAALIRGDWEELRRLARRRGRARR